MLVGEIHEQIRLLFLRKMLLFMYRFHLYSYIFVFTWEIQTGYKMDSDNVWIDQIISVQ